MDVERILAVGSKLRFREKLVDAQQFIDHLLPGVGVTFNHFHSSTLSNGTIRTQTKLEYPGQQVK